jgi:hypothetical protein
MTDIGAYDTRTLVKVVEDLRRPRAFLLDTFFPFIQTFDTEAIDFDKLETSHKPAPFVHPEVAARPTRSRGFTTRSFTPAYVKPMETVKPGRAMKRLAGERYTGDMTPVARLEATITGILAEQQKSILRRKEIMASEALRTGMVTVEGQDYPKVIVDYGRDTGLTVTLAGAARWGQAGVKPLDSLEDWAGLVQDASGTSPTDVVMDKLAWRLFRENVDVNNVLDNRRGTESPGLETAAVTVGNRISDARNLGSFGDFTFWLYNDTYEDEAGATQRLLPDYTVILGSVDIEGVQAHGAIQDVGSLQELEIFPKIWDEQNPSTRNVMSQSAPLPVPARTDASFCATVN